MNFDWIKRNPGAKYYLVGDDARYQYVVEVLFTEADMPCLVSYKAEFTIWKPNEDYVNSGTTNGMVSSDILGDVIYQVLRLYYVNSEVYTEI